MNLWASVDHPGDYFEMIYRFTTILKDLKCEVSFTLKKDKTILIQSINVIGDCVITLDDLEDDLQVLVLKEALIHFNQKSINST